MILIRKTNKNYISPHPVVSFVKYIVDGQSHIYERDGVGQLQLFGKVEHINFKLSLHCSRPNPIQLTA